MPDHRGNPRIFPDEPHTQEHFRASGLRRLRCRWAHPLLCAVDVAARAADGIHARLARLPGVLGRHGPGHVRPDPRHSRRRDGRAGPSGLFESILPIWLVAEGFASPRITDDGPPDSSINTAATTDTVATGTTRSIRTEPISRVCLAAIPRGAQATIQGRVGLSARGCRPRGWHRRRVGPASLLSRDSRGRARHTCSRISGLGPGWRPHRHRGQRLRHPIRGGCRTNAGRCDGLTSACRAVAGVERDLASLVEKRKPRARFSTRLLLAGSSFVI